MCWIFESNAVFVGTAWRVLYLCDGKTTEGGNHAWNLVKCNGDYYYVDTTWGDPVFQQEEGENTSQDAEQNSGQDAEASGNKANISYDYLCCMIRSYFQTHISG